MDTTVIDRQQRVRLLIDHFYSVAREYDAIHRETKKSVEARYGPFQVIDDAYTVINLLDNNKFTSQDIAALDAAIQSQAYQDGMSDAGVAILKLLMSLLVSGASIATTIAPLL